MPVPAEGVTCVTWQELIQASTNVANDPQLGQFRLDEKLKDPTAAALVNYLNGADLKFLQDNITKGDRVLSVVMDPTSWPVIIMGGRAILTNAVNNTKEQLIAVGGGCRFRGRYSVQNDGVKSNLPILLDLGLSGRSPRVKVITQP
ncbi:Uncharacterised protein [Leclercia adecarboxylata]|uniref:Uncharacterized protein n=1 Tax=Leclercia adecarboxylata TaxID=83655 RepID=A0A4V6JKD0_9ENTR|nr:Uncharacterised protein [Leclercia adecarboxylata]